MERDPTHRPLSWRGQAASILGCIVVVGAAMWLGYEDFAPPSQMDWFILTCSWILLGVPTCFRLVFALTDQFFKSEMQRTDLRWADWISMTSVTRMALLAMGLLWAADFNRALFMHSISSYFGPGLPGFSEAARAWVIGTEIRFILMMSFCQRVLPLIWLFGAIGVAISSRVLRGKPGLSIVGTNDEESVALMICWAARALYYWTVRIELP